MRGGDVAVAMPNESAKDEHEAARALFERALEIDPNDADALAGDAEYLCV